MTIDDRQHLRDRAADAVAPRHAVIIQKRNAWPSPLLGGTRAEQRRQSRARKRLLSGDSDLGAT